MVDYLADLGVWNWFILAAVLLVLEILVPGAFMLWFGLAAIMVGLISLAVIWPWQFQLLAFAAISIGSILVWRRISPVTETAPAPMLNRRAEGFVGRVFTLERPIVDGNGSVRIGDSIWMVRGPDTPAGARVKVTQADGGTLVVAPAEG